MNPKTWRDYVVSTLGEEYKKYLIISEKDIQEIDITYQRENN